MLRPRVVKLGAAVLSSSLLAAAFPAQAHSIRVRYNAEELRTAAGSQAVLDRIKSAAHRACMDGTRLRHSCREALTGDAVTRLGWPMVTALWTVESGRFQLASAQ